MKKKLFRVFVAFSVGLSALIATAAPAGAVGGLVFHSLYDWRCLDVYAGGAGPWVQMWNCTGQANQVFFAVAYPDGTREVRTSDYWCVDGRWGRGASLERSPCTGHVVQRWRFEPLSASGFAIRSVEYPDLVWDVYANGTGTKVQLWDQNLQRNQAWFTNAA